METYTGIVCIELVKEFKLQDKSVNSVPKHLFSPLPFANRLQSL